VSAPGPSRKRARRDALFVLYQHELTSAEPGQLYQRLRDDEGYPADEFTIQLVSGTIERRAEIDELIQRHTKSWSLSRLAPLERNTLRLATFELLDGETPPEVVIDEAVRLIKRYATDEAGALINGILGGILSEQRGDDVSA